MPPSDSPTSAETGYENLAVLPSQLAAFLPRIAASARPVVLLDGRSGSGKTTLAPLLAKALKAQVVRLEDIYPGWDGLETASRHIAEYVLDTENPRWRRFDWVLGEPAEWHSLDRLRPLVVEGCGALSRANRALATFGIWIELDQATRQRRALQRDGEMFSPHWERWASHEAEFAAREHPAAQADLILDGTLLGAA